MRHRLLPLLAILLLAFAGLRPSDATAQSNATKSWLDVEVGHSFIFKQDRAIARILVSDNEVAQIKLLEEGQFQIRGITVGSTDLWVWFRGDQQNPVSYELTVHRDLSDLVRRVDQAVEGNAPRTYPLLNRIVVEGPVKDIGTLEQIAGMARIYDEEFVNLITVEGDHQVQLEVVFAEVNRSGLRELGLNAMWGNNFLGAAMEGPGTVPSALATRPELDRLNGGGTFAPSTATFNILGTFGSPVNVAAIMSVLEQNSISKVLAQPTLVALSGQQAEFLAGGEIPIPVAQTGTRITIEFKEYGVKLVFVPTVLGEDVVDVRVYVEVSDVDSASGVRLTGIEIPGFVTRKSQSHLRVESGMTFAMAGMLTDNVKATYARVPLLGDIPIIGALFRYVQHKRQETELMIFVTPRLVRPMAEGEVPAPPGTTQNFNPNDFELFLLGTDHRVGTRTAEPTGPIGLAR